MILNGSSFVWETSDTFLDVHGELRPALKRAWGAWYRCWTTPRRCALGDPRALLAAPSPYLFTVWKVIRSVSPKSVRPRLSQCTLAPTYLFSLLRCLIGSLRTGGSALYLLWERSVQSLPLNTAVRGRSAERSSNLKPLWLYLAAVLEAHCLPWTPVNENIWCSSIPPTQKTFPMVSLVSLGPSFQSLSRWAPVGNFLSIIHNRNLPQAPSTVTSCVFPCCLGT